MKTFETESHNIPEGATHYSNENGTDVFAWFKSEFFVNYIWCPGVEGEEYWIRLVDQSEMYGEDVKPTPVAEEPEWVNGDAVFIGNKEIGKFIGVNPANVGDCFVYSNRDGDAKGYHLSQLSKPETQQQREERERLENGRAFYNQMVEIELTVMDPEDKGMPNTWDELRDDWQQVYIRQAEALSYKV